MDQIEVTDEMLEAGFEILSHSGILDRYDYYHEGDKLVLRDIFRAMRECEIRLQIDKRVEYLRRGLENFIYLTKEVS